MGELVAARALVRTWPGRWPAGSRRRWRAAGAGAAGVAVVGLCTAAWWDPAVQAVLEAIGTWLVQAATEAMTTAAEQFMSLAFNNPLTEISDAEWQVATRQAARWGAVFAVVAVGACAVEVVAALIVRDTTRVLRAGVVAALAWPMTVAVILALAELVAVTDGLSGAMFDNVADADPAGAMTLAVGGLAALSVGGGWVVVVIGALVCIVGLVMIAMVMAARAFGLVVGAGFAPVALMLVGFSGTRGMARKWVEVMAGLLLAKPLAAGIIVLCLELAGSGSLDSFIMGTVGLWVAVFSPALAMSLVSFAGGHLSAALTAHAGALKGIGAQATQAGATRLALQGLDSEALGELGSKAAGLAKTLGGLVTGRGTGPGAPSTPGQGEDAHPEPGEQPDPPERDQAPATDPADSTDAADAGPDTAAGGDELGEQDPDGAGSGGEVPDGGLGDGPLPAEAGADAVPGAGQEDPDGHGLDDLPAATEPLSGPGAGLAAEVGSGTDGHATDAGGSTGSGSARAAGGGPAPIGASLTPAGAASAAGAGGAGAGDVAPSGSRSGDGGSPATDPARTAGDAPASGAAGAPGPVRAPRPAPGAGGRGPNPFGGR